MCTSFTLKAKDNSVIVGRSMENAASLGSEIFFQPLGTSFRQRTDWVHQITNGQPKYKDGQVNPQQHLLSWTSKYGFVGITVLGSDVVTHGMNDQGLVTGTMTLNVSEYESSQASDNNIFYPYLTNYLLSMCANCQDVIDVLGNNGGKATRPISVINPFENINQGFYAHFPVNDADGNALVIEFVDGELNLYDNSEIGVLTNEPQFQWQVTNLTNYTHIQPVNIQDLNSDIFDLIHRPVSPSSGGIVSHLSPSELTTLIDDGNVLKNPFSHIDGNIHVQGTGFVGLPGSSTPADRFVRTYKMAKYAYQAESAEEGVVAASHILNTVDIPFGTSRENHPEGKGDEQYGDYTQWVTISDTSNLMYYVRGYDSPMMYSIDFKKLTGMPNGDWAGKRFDIPDMTAPKNSQIAKPLI